MKSKKTEAYMFLLVQRGTSPTSARVRERIRNRAKANQAVPHQEHRRGAHLPYVCCWARIWIDDLSPWCMASAKPDLRLPSQPQSVTAFWPVPNYTAWWTEAHVREQLVQGCLIFTWLLRAKVEPATSWLQVRHAVLGGPWLWWSPGMSDENLPS